MHIPNATPESLLLALAEARDAIAHFERRTSGPALGPGRGDIELNDDQWAVAQNIVGTIAYRTLALMETAGLPVDTSPVLEALEKALGDWLKPRT